MRNAVTEVVVTLVVNVVESTWRCGFMCVFCSVSMCEGLHASICEGVHVNLCVSLHAVCMCMSPVWVLQLSSKASYRRGDCETMGTDITVRGRGVSRQPAGYPITLGVLLLHPLPSALPSREVSRGEEGSSLCHYPSITCLSLCWQQNFLPSLLTLYPQHQL